MRIKKLTAVAMTGMMVLGMGTSVCAAPPITSVDGNDTHDVKATYDAQDKADIVYSVDIEWGSMEYKYTVSSEGTWDPETHSFKDATKGEWTCNDGEDEVTVKNHSNAPVKAAFSYTPEADYNTITGNFDEKTVDLPTAEDTELSNAPKATSTLSLSGALKKNVTTPTTIGTATVTLNAAD